MSKATNWNDFRVLDVHQFKGILHVPSTVRHYGNYSALESFNICNSGINVACNRCPSLVSNYKGFPVEQIVFDCKNEAQVVLTR